MELGHLKHFYYVAKLGGFTKASKELMVQQPSISKTVSQLEESLEMKLLVREKRKVYLTDIGEEVYKHCDNIFKEIDQIKLISTKGKLECNGPLTFCASEPISSHFVPQVHKSFLDQYPHVVPACFSGFAMDLFNKIENGYFEFGLFFHTPAPSSRIHIENVCQIPYDLVIKSSEYQNKNIIRSFIGSREVDNTQTKTFPTISRMNKDYRNVQIKISSNSLTSHKNMVLEGLGVSVLPARMVENEIKSKKLKRLYPKGTFNFPLKLVTKKTHYLSRNARAWIETMKKDFKGIKATL